MIKHSKIDDLEKNHKSEHEDYEYFKRDFLPRGLTPINHSGYSSYTAEMLH